MSDEQAILLVFVLLFVCMYGVNVRVVVVFEMFEIVCLCICLRACVCVL